MDTSRIQDLGRLAIDPCNVWHLPLLREASCIPLQHLHATMKRFPLIKLSVKRWAKIMVSMPRSMPWNPSLPPCFVAETPGEAPPTRDALKALEKRLADGLARIDAELRDVCSREGRYAATEAADQQVRYTFQFVRAHSQMPESALGGRRTVHSATRIKNAWVRCSGGKIRFNVTNVVQWADSFGRHRAISLR